MANPLADVRRQQLKALIPSRFQTQAKADEGLGFAQGYTSFILTGRKDLGEKLARRAEIKAGLPNGYFDRQESNPGLTPAQAELADALKLAGNVPDEQARLIAALIRSSQK